jgi:hypothetical protein
VSGSDGSGPVEPLGDGPALAERAPEEKPREVARADPAHGIARQGRRLSDKILVAFHHACDQHDLEVAEHLLRVVELMLHRPIPGPDPNRRRNLDGLVAAHERLWHLRKRSGAPQT